MPFINEYISESDRLKYGLESVDEKFPLSMKSRTWTVDHERSIYLRVMNRGREDRSHISTWVLNWKGHLVPLEIHTVESGGELNGVQWATKRLEHLWLPESIAEKREEVIADLKEALIAYRDGGVFATASRYELTLNDAEQAQ